MCFIYFGVKKGNGEERKGGRRKREGGIGGAIEGIEAITDNLPSPRGLRS
jgi:hypothetical protein